MALRFNVSQSTGNANTLATGSVVGGTALVVNDNSRQKLRALTAHLTLLADTNTFTWAAKWQVSNDNSTWIDCTNGPQNAASVVLATGTAGADTAVTRAMEAPQSVYSYKFARVALVTGGTTGASIDTYTIGYSYRAPA